MSGPRLVSAPQSVIRAPEPVATPQPEAVSGPSTVVGVVDGGLRDVRRPVNGPPSGHRAATRGPP